MEAGQGLKKSRPYLDDWDTLKKTFEYMYSFVYVYLNYNHIERTNEFGLIGPRILF